MYAAIRNISGSSSRTFNIIEEFADLTPGRKMALCDSLFKGGDEPFRGAVRALWPEASSTDTVKLEKFLILIRKATH